MIETTSQELEALAPNGGGAPVAHNRSDHLANERTHLAYLRTAVSLISLGITVNRFSIYLEQQNMMPTRRGAHILGGTARAGAGMVIYALVLMLLGLHRYLAVEKAIARGTDYHDRRLVVTLTLTAIIGGALGILWMFQP